MKIKTKCTVQNYSNVIIIANSIIFTIIIVHNIILYDEYL